MLSFPRKRTLSAWRAAGGALIAAVGLFGPLAAAAEPLADFDVQQSRRGLTLPAPPAAQGQARVNRARAAAAALPGAEVKFDGLIGGASRVWNPRQWLTGPSNLSAEEIGERFIAGNPGLYQLDALHARSLEVARRMTTQGTGVTHVTLRQEHNDIPVFKSDVKVHVTARGEVISVSGTPMPDLDNTINAEAPRLPHAQALALAGAYAGIMQPLPDTPDGAPEGPRQKLSFPGGDVLSRTAEVQLVYLPTDGRATSLAWEVTLWQHRVPDVYYILVDAVNGSLLYRHNLTSYSPQGTVYDKEGPFDEYPFTGTTPLALARVVRPFDGRDHFGVLDFHYDWWNGRPSTRTDGNNVVAAAARSFATTGAVIAAFFDSPTSNYTFPLDLNQDPIFWSAAATANLYYWNNRLHDIWYRFGFNEDAGNFQTDNFEKGGLRYDAVRAYAQFGAAVGIANNATFATPPDGSPGEMRMFETTFTIPKRDTDLSNIIIAHEFGHGVTNRLVGNGFGLRGFQAGGMGEGWSDFQAMMVLIEPNDNPFLPYPQAGWAFNDFVRGIRNEPYSTNPQVFRRTFANIVIRPPGFPFVHDAGEVMCNTLFQMFAGIRNRLGFTEARQRAMQLFIDALKLTPDEPTFLDYRNAILIADKLRYSGGDVGDIWIAFASRGMGVASSTFGSIDTFPVEAFDLPPLERPVNLFATALSATSVRLTWTDNSVTEAGFKIEVKTPGGNYTEIPDLNIGPNVTTATINDLAPATAYVFRVRAFVGSLFSFYSNEASITTPPLAIAPAAPTNLQAGIASPTEVRLTWQDNANNELTFLVEQKRGAGNFAQVPGLNLAPNTTTVNVQVDPATNYTFRVRAFNASGNSGYSNEASLTTPAVPARPTGLVASALSPTAVQLRWTDRANNEDGYRVEMRSGTDAFTEVAQLAANTTLTQVSDLTEVTLYTFRVRAFNALGPSAYSNEATATTQRGVPAAPTGLNVTTTGSRVLRLGWSDNSTNETGYQVQYHVAGSNTVRRINLPKNSRTATLGPLTPNTSYVITVAAYNERGFSALSNEVTARTAAALRSGK